jgi:hypothetical protein
VSDRKAHATTRTIRAKGISTQFIFTTRSRTGLGKALPGLFGPFTVFKQALTVRLGDTLNLILLLDGIGVGGSLGGVDELISKALSDGLDVLEGRLEKGNEGRRKKGDRRTIRARQYKPGGHPG